MHTAPDNFGEGPSSKHNPGWWVPQQGNALNTFMASVSLNKSCWKQSAFDWDATFTRNIRSSFARKLSMSEICHKNYTHSGA